MSLRFQKLSTGDRCKGVQILSVEVKIHEGLLDTEKTILNKDEPRPDVLGWIGEGLSARWSVAVDTGRINPISPLCCPKCVTSLFRIARGAPIQDIKRILGRVRISDRGSMLFLLTLVWLFICMIGDVDMLRILKIIKARISKWCMVSWAYRRSPASLQRIWTVVLRWVKSSP